LTRVGKSLSVLALLPGVFGAAAYAAADGDHNIDGATAYIIEPYRAGADALGGWLADTKDTFVSSDGSAAGTGKKPDSSATATTETPPLIIIPSASATTTSTETATMAPSTDCEQKLAALPNSTLIENVITWPVSGDGTSYYGDLNTAETIAFVRSHKFGGLLIASKVTNPEAVKEILKPENYTNDPIVMVDDEGRLVNRMPEDGSGPAFPNASEMGTMTNEQVAAIAKNRAQLLKGFYVDAALAPVTDVPPQDGSVTGIEAFRFFGKTPDVVAEKAGVYGSALKKAGVNPVYKHFAGGSQVTREGKHSDYGVAYTGDIETLKSWDLQVFEGKNGKNLAVTDGRTGVMMGNYVVGGGFTHNKPASVDPTMYELAKENGFQFITTDDLGAPGVNQPLSQSLVEAWQAGATLPLFVQNTVDPDKTAEEQLQSIINRAKATMTTEPTFRQQLLGAIKANATFVGKTTCEIASDLEK
jgi:beta-glucosidase-like glycosyl hydrolase